MSENIYSQRKMRNESLKKNDFLEFLKKELTMFQVYWQRLADNQSSWGFAKLVEGLSWGFGVKNSIVVEGSSWGAGLRVFHEGLTWGYETGSGITPDP